MKHISFSWTTAALLAGAKTCTRRSWNDAYAKRFHAGDLVAAYDKSPRAGGKQIATIRLTRDPYQEFVRDAPPEDYQREGLAWMEERGVLIQRATPRQFWADWQAANTLEWVIRFEGVKGEQDGET